jgi:ATP-dependent exoDNAse (exonuclease V) beta subunit
LLARIDLLIETDEELAVVDFKTARSRWSAEQAATHQSQQTGVAGHSRLWKTV